MAPSPEVQAYVRDAQANFNFRRTVNGLPLGNLPFPSRKPRAAWYNYTTRSAAVYDDLDDVLRQTQEDTSQTRRAVCVIEAIDWHWVGRLGHHWKIDPAFFAHHGTNPDIPDSKDIWPVLFPLWHNGLCRPDNVAQASKSVHIDGVYQYHSLSNHIRVPSTLEPMTARASTFSRLAWVPLSPYPPSCTTRISYHRVHNGLYLILVDPPFYLGNPPPVRPDQLLKPTARDARSDTDLRMCYSGNRGGMSMPQPVNRKAHSLFQIFQHFFEHGWHLNILFADAIGLDKVITPSAFLHLVVASVWQENFRTIESEIKAISFRELHEPKMATNVKLHILRELLTRTSGGMVQTNKFVPMHVRDFYKAVYSDPKNVDRMNYDSPVQQLVYLIGEVMELQRFLMDSFQLLISSVSVIETVTSAQLAKVSLEQASRAAKLTQLAFIYVPLSFVTSVYGMNIKEINDSPLSVWVCFVTLVIVVAATAAIFGGYELFETFRPKRAGDEETDHPSPPPKSTSDPARPLRVVTESDLAGKPEIWAP